MIQCIENSDLDGDHCIIILLLSECYVWTYHIKLNEINKDKSCVYIVP